MPAPAAQVTALRALIEQIQSAPDLTDAQRARHLRGLRRDVADLLGQIDSYAGSTELARESAAIDRRRDLVRARARADVRDRVKRDQGLSEEELDRLGFLSHERLDGLAQEGRLEEALADVPREAA